VQPLPSLESQLRVDKVANDTTLMNDTTKQDEEQPTTNKGKMVTPASSSTDSIQDQSGQGDDSKQPAASSRDEKGSGSGSPSGDAPHHPIAEFLYQLTKMLQDDNDEIIEWTHGRIKVHYPERLETEVLHKYFRHSKFASFQRQLNYFGFRKIAGKGKMAPCSYVNEACTNDIKSLLHIKRKTNGSAARKAAMNRAIAAERLQAAAAAGNFATLGANLPPHLRPDMAELMSQALGVSNPAWLGQQLQAQSMYQNTNNLARDQALAAFAAGQKRQSASDFARYGLNPAALGALEQLQQLGNAYAGASAAPAPGFSQQQQAAMAALGMQAPMPAAPTPADMGSASMANSMPATAAMNAAAGKTSNNLFEGNPNLKSLVNEQPQQGHPKGPNNGSLSNRVASQNLMNRLPSSGTIFPDSLSSASLSHLLPGAGGGAGAGSQLSSNRLSSMISLSSYLSREPSLVDLLLASQPPGGGGQFNPALAAAAAGMRAPAPSDDPNKRFGNPPM